MTEKYSFVDAEYAELPAGAGDAPTIVRMCGWLGVSKSGYYEWRSRPQSVASERRELLKIKIKALFEADNEEYGYRRMHAALVRGGEDCCEELVRQLMRELGLEPCQPKPWRRSLTDPDHRRGRHVVPRSTSIVFVTKYRRAVLDADILQRCQDAMRKVCGDLGVQLYEFNGDDDHVHLLVQYPPKAPVSALMNSLKGVSPRRLRSQFTGRVNRYITHGALLVAALTRRVLRTCPAEHHSPVHRAAKASGSSNRRANSVL